MNVSQLTVESEWYCYTYTVFYTLKCSFLQEFSDISRCKNGIFWLI